MSNAFTLKEIASILEMMQKHDVTEFKLEHGEEKIFLRREQARAAEIHSLHGNYGSQHFHGSGPMGHGHQQTLPSNVIPLVSPVESSVPHVVVQGGGQAGGSVVQPIRSDGANSGTTNGQEGASRRQVREITSPMVGTFYRRPAVDAEPYVDEGDVVKKGDVICIVEAMKLMNEIEADLGGKIVEICIEDGQMVEFGEVLFRMEAV